MSNTNINTGLPLVFNRQSVELDISSELAGRYCVLAVGRAYWVARDVDGVLVVRVATGDILRFESVVSELNETNVAIVPNNVVFCYRGANNDILLTAVNLQTGGRAVTHYLTSDPGFPSFLVGNNETHIYKSDLSSGTPGKGWHFIINNTNLAFLTRVQDSSGLPSDVKVHLGVSPAGNFYRGYRTATSGALEALNVNSLAATDIYSSSFAGATVIQNSDVTSLYYPVIDEVNGTAYVMDETLTSFQGWSLTTVNQTDTAGPINIDTRPNKFGLNNLVAFPLLQLDSSNNTVSHTRTYFRWDSANAVQLTVQDLNLCIEINDTTNLLSNKINTQIYDSGSSVAFLLEDSVNRIYNLNSADFCPIVISGLYTQGYRLDGARGIQQVKPTQLHPTITPDFIDDAPRYADADFLLSGAGTSFTVNGGTPATLTSNLSDCTVNVVDRTLYIRDAAEVLRVAQGSSAVQRSAASNINVQVYSLVINSKIFYFHSNGISIWNTLTQTEEVVPLTFTRFSRVRLFVNEFRNEVYLFDRDFPNELRLLNLEPNLFDYTERSVYINVTTLLTTSFPSATAKAANSANWTILQADPERIIYIDYSNGQYEVINRRVVIGPRFGPIQVQPVLTPQPSQSLLGGLVFDHNSLEIIELTGSLLNQQSLNNGVLGKLAARTTNEGYLELLTDTGTQLIYNSLFPVVDSTPLERNAIRLTANKDISVILSQKELTNYSIKPIANQAGQVSHGNAATRISSVRALEFLFEAKVQAVVDSDKLLGLLNIFQTQWSSDSWLLDLEDRIYPLDASSTDGRPTTAHPNAALRYVAYSMAIVDLDWQWHSDELYEISITLTELSSEQQ